MRPATADTSPGAGNETLMCVPSVDLTARSEGDCKQGRPTLDFGLNHDDEDKGEGDEGGVNVALAPALGSILVARGGLAGAPAAKRTRHSRLCRRRPTEGESCVRLRMNT